jgi:tetratricopeptide (TPR) repeat protein
MTSTALKFTTPLVIIALSLALNLHGLAVDSFWGDEILTATFAGQSFPEVIRWTAEDIHPPLYYLITGTFARFTTSLGSTDFPAQTSDWLWRFPSVVAVVLTLAISYKLAREILGFETPLSRFEDYVSLSAILLLAVSPTVIKYAQEARMHALFMLLAVLSSLLLFRALRRPASWLRWVAYALAMAATIYTMYFGFLIMTAHGILVMSRVIQQRNLAAARRPRQMLVGFAGAIGFVGVLYLPWWPVLFDILRKRAAVGAIEGGVGEPATFLLGVVTALGPSPATAAWLFFGLYIGGLMVLLRHNWPVALFAASWLVLPAILPILLGDPRALQFRYAFVLPIYLLVVSLALWQLTVRLGARQFPRAGQYAVWVLTTVSLIGSLQIYEQTKPNWREAAAYLSANTAPADIILIGPLWDEGRFIGYYYRGQAPLLTPAAMVTNIEGRLAGLRQGNGRIWAVNRFAPTGIDAFDNHSFSGVVISEPRLAVFEAEPLTGAALNLAGQAVDAAYSWAAEAEAQGVLNPDPRTARAAALRAQGDTLLAAGQPEAAISAYRAAVESFPGWVGGFLALAEAHRAAGNLPATAEAYRNAVKFNLDWHGPAADSAAELVDAGEWQAAIEAYQQLVDH